MGPSGKSVPLQSLDKITGFVNNQDTPMFVCCRSGTRNGQAVSALHRMGYKTIGGIAADAGKVERYYEGHHRRRRGRRRYRRGPHPQIGRAGGDRGI